MTTFGHILSLQASSMVTIITTFDHQITAVVAAITTTHFYLIFPPLLQLKLEIAAHRRGFTKKERK
jgi:multisubunit Na+/H+ antiporter MnhG subunit